ncbi:amino acid transporter [Lasius niger]|uniref:Amino acid transporter n=1 Tax=Lasius niger TaxID=67767 RepID=A0A0J7N2W0_LASNI|nr:amino acid transporter [Lasius niger]
MGAKDLKSAVAVALFASTLPTWWIRGVHIALFGQWVLLIALGAYFRAMRNECLKWDGFLNFWAALIFLIHPYLCVMLLAIAAAVPVSALARKNIPFAVKSLLGLIAACILIVIFAVTCGYTNNLVVIGGSFKELSMDLLAPFWPENSPIFHTKAINPSMEGFQYLGLGLLALSGAALWVAYKFTDLKAILWKHAGILAACLGLLFIATGQLHIAGIRPFGDFTFGFPLSQDLRSCGRFFWPISYLIILCTLYLLRNLKWHIWLPLVGTCLCLQMIERGHHWGEGGTNVYATSATEAEKNYIALVQQHDFVQIYPRLECSDFSKDFYSAMRSIYAASLKDIPVNSMYLARTPKPAACARSGKEDFIPTDHPNSLYVLTGALMVSPFISSVSAFFVTAALIDIPPGLELLLAISTTTTIGRRAGVGVGVGVGLGIFTWCLASIVGLSALVMRSPSIFQIIKWVGVAYLIWIAGGFIWSAIRNTDPMQGTDNAKYMAKQNTLFAGFKQGYLTSVLNPNVALMFLVIFTPFIPHGQNFKPWILFYGISESLMEAGYLILVAFLAAPMTQLLKNDRVRDWFEGIAGLVLLFIALQIALTSGPS